MTSKHWLIAAARCLEESLQPVPHELNELDWKVSLTNTSLRERFKLHDKQRNQITNLISDAVDAGRIKRKDVGSGNKFAEYLPYWA